MHLHEGTDLVTLDRAGVLVGHCRCARRARRARRRRGNRLFWPPHVAKELDFEEDLGGQHRGAHALRHALAVRVGGLQRALQSPRRHLDPVGLLAVLVPVRSEGRSLRPRRLCVHLEFRLAHDQSGRVEAGVARLEALRHDFGGLVRLVGRATQRLQPREVEPLRLLGGHAQPLRSLASTIHIGRRAMQCRERNGVANGCTRAGGAVLGEHGLGGSWQAQIDENLANQQRCLCMVFLTRLESKGN